MWAGRRFAGRLQVFVRDRQGALALNFALILLPLSVITCGAVDMASVYSDRQLMQHVADATALDAAAQLVLANTSGIQDRADAFALGRLSKIAGRVSLTTETTVSKDGASVTVAIDGHRPSFFVNLLPPGGFHLRAAATAMSMGRTPLCVLHSGTKHDMTMDDSAVITAPGCLIHSDSDIQVMKSATLTAETVEAVGTAAGRILPAPLTGAAQVPDPFASMTIDIPKKVLICNPLDLIYDLNLTYTLDPGVHCGNIKVAKNATVRLAPGNHYFAKGKLSMEEGSVLTGTDVVLIFDSNADLAFKDNATIELEGRKSGPYAGFVIATTRANKGRFEISSDNARKLLGTIYAPNATLAVSGSASRVADQSAWTVIVADAIQLSGSPNLVINSNYAGASVPVPGGVGKNRGVVLTR